MQADDREALGRTLEQAGIPGFDLTKIDVLGYSRPDSDQSDRVRTLANDTLLDLIEKDQVGSCIHVTGEMRALSDPFHRRVCGELYKRTEAKFSLIYNIPEQYRLDPVSVGKWNAKTWPKSGWVDRLSAFSLIGNDLVDVYAFNTENLIQFTVFGHSYVLLQSDHRDEPSGAQAKKRVWLLKSEKLNGEFSRIAHKMRGDASKVPDALFKRFSASVHSVTSREIIRRLLKAGTPAHLESVVDNNLLDFDPDALQKIESLQTMGFVERNGQEIGVTENGRQYLGAMNE